MPAEVQTAPSIAGQVRISSSAPVQLYSALYMIGFLHLRERTKAPWVREFVDAHPDLLTRLDEVYHAIEVLEADDCATSCWEGSDILVYALASGTIEDPDLDRFFERLPAVAAREYGHIRMPTESPEIEDAVSERITRNARDPEVRAKYVSVLKDIWGVLGKDWAREGRDRTAADCRTLQVQAESAQSIEELIPSLHISRRERYFPWVKGGLERGEVLITPLYFSGPGGEGQHVVEVPGLVSIGFGLSVGTRLEEIKARADQAATKLKALSDPTRATLLKLVHKHEYSITDLATILGVSQPTVSVHMKQLREAGLVEMKKSGQFTLYTAPEGRIERFLGEAADDLLDR